MNEPTPQTEAGGAGGRKPPGPAVSCADAGEPWRREYELFRRAIEALRRTRETRGKD